LLGRFDSYATRDVLILLAEEPEIRSGIDAIQKKLREAKSEIRTTKAVSNVITEVKYHIDSSAAGLEKIIKENAGKLQADIDKLSTSIGVNIMDKLSSMEDNYRQIESRNSQALILLDGQLSELKAERESNPMKQRELTVKIAQVTEERDKLLDYAKKIAKFPALQDKELRSLEKLAETSGKDISTQKREADELLKGMEKLFVKHLQTIRDDIEEKLEKSTSTVMKFSLSMEKHAFPSVFHLIKATKHPDIKGKIKSLWSHAWDIYCCCEFQCASKSSNKVPLPIWHPVATKENSADPFFRVKLWEIKSSLKKLAPVLKLSYAALKIAASVYAIPLPSLPKELLEEIDVTSMAKDVGIDFSFFEKDESQLIDEVKRGISRLPCATQMDPSIITALRELFPQSVCFLITLSSY
jgi:hypothetical protein